MPLVGSKRGDNLGKKPSLSSTSAVKPLFPVSMKMSPDSTIGTRRQVLSISDGVSGAGQ